MKICVMGYSGSGKSTLAGKLAEHHKTDVLYLDTVHWLPGWQERDPESKQQIVQEFLDTHQSWVIDGNYSSLFYERRLEEADQIILLLFNRWRALARVWRRYGQYQGKSRPDMTEGCPEKLDWTFIRWVLHDGRTKRAKQRYRQVLQRYPEKTVVLKSQRQISAYESKVKQRI